MLSRREFVLASVGAAVTRRQSPGPGGWTAQQVLDRLRTRVGVPWRESTVDGFKAGDPGTVVTGIATTVMATFDVLRKAAAARQNLVITTEPVFYASNDAPGPRGSDPVYLAKKAFIDEHRFVILRFADHWNARVPSEPVRALANLLGWSQHRVADQESIYQPPVATLSALVAAVEKRLGVRGVRVVGPSGMRVSKVLLSPGTTDLATTVKALPRVDVVIAGEPREWEVVPYVLDAGAAGQSKALISLGRIVSERPGSEACAEWLRSVIEGVPIESIPVPDPYWRPTP